jgi:endonuclease/exonuclease/phosphatase family metal-dependent hydrolase
MWHLDTMRSALRSARVIRLLIQTGIATCLSSTAVAEQRLEPTCLAASGGQEVRWARGPEDDRPQLDRWCAGVGSPLLRDAMRETRVPGAEDFVVVVWNLHLGAGAVASLVDDLRAGRLNAGRPVAHFALLLQEVHRDLGEVLPSLPPGARTARRVAPGKRHSDILSVAENLDLHLLYVPSMRNGGGDQPPEDRGNAILSTLPLRDPRALELPLERQRRVAVAAHVQLGSLGAGLLLVSAHLDNRSSWRDAFRSFGRGRARQARWLVGALDGEAAVALGGDFNTWLRGSDAQALRLLREHFPLPEASPRGPTLVIPFLPDRVVDHLLLRLPAGWTAEYRVAADPLGSDHRPLLGNLRPPPLGRAW